MNIIVNVDLNWAIGKNNTLLYSVPEDMKFFRETTMGKTVVCGRNTLLSFPGSKPLPNRKNIVLSPDELPGYENMVRVADLDELKKAVSELPEDDVFICGGASVYTQLYKYCKKLYVTRTYASDDETTVFFPNLDKDPDFKLVASSEKMLSTKGLWYQFLTYENKNPLF